MWQLYPYLRKLWIGVILGGLGLFLVNECLYGWLFKGESCTLNQAVQDSLPTYGPLALALFLALLVLTLWAWWDSRRHKARERTREAQESFDLLKSANELRPEDMNFQVLKSGEFSVQDKRPFNPTYIPRSAVTEDASNTYNEEDLVEQLRANKGFVLLGPPLDGKSRTLYEIVQQMDNYEVLRPKSDKRIPGDADFSLLLKGRRVVLLLDDLSDYVGREPDLLDFGRMLGYHAQTWVVAATCRDEPELAAVETGLGKFYEDIHLKLRLVPPTPKEQERLAKSTGKEWVSEVNEKEYPTLGSIIMEKPMEAMIRRFNKLLREHPERADILRALKLLAAAGILPYTYARLRAVLEHIFQSPPFHLVYGLEALAGQSFLRLVGQASILPEPAYLRDAVTYTKGKNPTDDFADLEDVLEEQNDHEGLYYLGNTYALFLKDYRKGLACWDRAIRLKPGYLDAWFMKGGILLRLGHLQEALQAYEQALSPRSDSQEGIYLAVSWILTQLGRYEEALEVSEKGLNLNPDSPQAQLEAWLVKSRALPQLGRSEEALEASDKILNLISESPEASWLGWEITPSLSLPVSFIKSLALSQLGRYEEALEASEESLSLRPESPEGWFAKGVALSGLERYEEALEASEKVLSLTSESAEEAWASKSGALVSPGQLHRVLEAFSKSRYTMPDLLFWAWQTKGLVLAELNRPQEALDAIERALSLRPNLLPEAWNKKSVLLNELNRHEEALRAAERALNLNPDSPEAWSNKRVALFNLGQFEEALEASEKVLNLYPDDPEAWLIKSGVLFPLGRFEEALEASEKALNLSPDSLEAWFQKIAALGSLERYEEALEASEKALILNLDSPDVWLAKSEVLRYLERYEEALEASEKALNLNPGPLVAWFQKISALGSLERYEEALEASEKALNLNPDSPDVWLVKSEVLRNLKRYEEALEASEKALNLKPDSLPEAWENKGMALKELERHDEAVEWLCQAWRVREHLQDKGLQVTKALRDLRQDPEECQEKDSSSAGNAP